MLYTVGISTVALGLIWWSAIQKGRENDPDFELRDAFREEP